MSRKNKRIKDKPKADAIAVPAAAPDRLILVEDIIIGLIVAAALFLFTTQLNSHFTLPKLAAVGSLTVALLGTFLVRLNSGQYRVLPVIIWLPLLLLVIWWLIGTSQSIHLQTALEGQYGRYNGLYLNLILVTLFVVIASIPYDAARFRRFLSVFILMMLGVCLYAFVQYLGLDPVLGRKAGLRPPSSVGNPVALGAIILLALPFALAEIWLCSRRSQKITAVIILLVLAAIFILSASRGPIIGVAVGLVAGFVVWLLFQSTLNKKIRVLLLSLIGSCIAAVIAAGVYVIQSGVSFGVSIDRRLLYFKAAGQMIMNSPLYGFGFETLRWVYPLYRPIHDALLSKQIVTPTMIHNDYLQLAADNGVLAMLFYLIFVGGLLWLIVKAIKTGSENKLLPIAILVMLSSYLIQGLSGWLEAASSVMFWLVLAVSTSFILHRVGNVKVATRTSTKFYLCMVMGGLAVSSSYAVMMTVKVKQDYTLRKAQSYAQANHSKTDEYLRWLGESSERDAYYQDRIGIVYLQRLVSQGSIKIYHAARKYFLNARALNAFDPYIRFHIIETDTVALQKRLIQKPSTQAREELNEIVRMDPNNPTVYQVRAGLFAAMGKRRAAQRELFRMQQILTPQKSRATD